MKIFGIELWRRKTASEAVPIPAPSRWMGLVLESFAGAWQSSVTIDRTETLLSYGPVFAIITGIASDVAKMRAKLMRLDEKTGIWKEDDRKSPFAPVLRKPNHYQNRIKFIQAWIISKLIYGNTYVLKERDARGVVVGLYILDPRRVTPLVAPNGSIFYRCAVDNLTGLMQEITVPASEIIHDLMCPLWHPLVGVSPLYAAAVSATQGNRIQGNSAQFFQNMSRPSGVLTGPGEIGDETAARLKAAWESNFSGGNIGKVAVVGDDLKYIPMSIPAEQSQLVEQLNWTVADCARPFHYPIHKLTGTLPAGYNVESTNLMYYTDCLQILIEDLELCLDEGIELPADLGVELDISGLIRMDAAGRYKKYESGIKAGWMKPNEARAEENLDPVAGGGTPYMQQQNFSLAALEKRDATDDPFKTAGPAPSAAPAAANDEEEEEEEEEGEGEGKTAAAELAAVFVRGLLADAAN